jgi:hypothetical protein
VKQASLKLVFGQNRSPGYISLTPVAEMSKRKKKIIRLMHAGQITV